MITWDDVKRNKKNSYKKKSNDKRNFLELCAILITEDGRGIEEKLGALNSILELITDEQVRTRVYVEYFIATVALISLINTANDIYLRVEDGRGWKYIASMMTGVTLMIILFIILFGGCE